MAARFFLLYPQVKVFIFFLSFKFHLWYINHACMREPSYEEDNTHFFIASVWRRYSIFVQFLSLFNNFDPPNYFSLSLIAIENYINFYILWIYYLLLLLPLYTPNLERVKNLRTKLLKRQQANDFENEEQATPTTFYYKKREREKRKIFLNIFFLNIILCDFIHITNDE